MAGVIPNSGEEVAANYFCNKDAPENLILRLFKSNTTPSETDTDDIYTEVDESGYSAIELEGSDWTVTPGGPTTAAAAQQKFELEESVNVYGYYLTRKTSGELMGAERFSGAPFSLPGGGGDVSVTPTISFGD